MNREVMQFQRNSINLHSAKNDLKFISSTHLRDHRVSQKKVLTFENSSHLQYFTDLEDSNSS